MLRWLTHPAPPPPPPPPRTKWPPFRRRYFPMRFREWKVLYFVWNFMKFVPMGLIGNTSALVYLTHWGRGTHICVVKLTIIGSDNDLSPGRRQTIIWTNARILLIGPLGTNFSEILIEIQTFSFKKMHLKMSSAKWRPFYLGLIVLMAWCWIGDKPLSEQMMV